MTNQYISNTGQTFQFCQNFTKGGPNTESNAILTVVVPPGILVTGFSVNGVQQSYTSGLTLALGTISNSPSSTAVCVDFVVDDIATATTSLISTTISGDQPDTNSNNNSGDLQLVKVPAVGSISPNENSGLKDTAIFTACNVGTTEVRIEAGSEVNATVTFVDANKGIFTWGNIINPAIDSTVGLELYCDGVKIDGPETYTLKPILASNTVLGTTLCDASDNIVVLTINSGGDFEYKLLDNSPFPGDPLTLKNCCCD